MAEGKTLLASVQRKTVTAQVAAWSERHHGCEVCGERRRIKGSYPFSSIPSTAMSTCAARDYIAARAKVPEVQRPCRHCEILLPVHVAPERLHLEARWAPVSAVASTWAVVRLAKRSN